MAAPKPVQGELLETAHIKFVGADASAFGTPPELGDTQVFTVTSRCTAVTIEEREDGEVRHIRKMKVTHIAFGEITKAERDPQLSLVDDPGELAADEPDGD